MQWLLSALPRSPRFLFFVTVSAVLIGDQVTKSFAQHSGKIVLNSGISLGLLGSLSAPLLLMLLSVGLGWWVWQSRVALLAHPVAWGAFLGGAVSNLGDRVLFGGVRDWFLLPLPGLPLRNNLADWAIVLAALWLVRCTIYNSHHHEPS